eukprot:TRINITY_DN1085_c0_g6_i2.p1 TRINITY_DN1085_c0_g6~~TRINITY_DN1085_c0_g6_i2.p1  ORF type:complete len:271 (+),score=55.58 TRINITY_DN1085_c0_g6_i2:241-1053(+)
MKLKNYLLLILILVNMSILAQEKTVTGTVTDKTGALPGVSVIIKGTNKGTETDFDGKYAIKVNQGDILVFSFVGLKTIERTVGVTSILNIKMEEDANLLDEVVVVAYGTTTKEAFTGSASVLGVKDLATRNVTSPIAAIEGRATGIQFTSSAGPGASPDIVIRGVGTLNGDTDPLFIVDGIQYEGELNTINQEDIESFTVLKDASSTSLYGSRAANGVVIITTKKGKKGGVRVNLTAQSGVVANGVQTYDQVSPGQYYDCLLYTSDAADE